MGNLCHFTKIVMRFTHVTQIQLRAYHILYYLESNKPPAIFLGEGVSGLLNIFRSLRKKLLKSL